MCIFLFMIVLGQGRPVRVISYIFEVQRGLQSPPLQMHSVEADDRVQDCLRFQS